MLDQFCKSAPFQMSKSGRFAIHIWDTWKTSWKTELQDRFTLCKNILSYVDIVFKSYENSYYEKIICEFQIFCTKINVCFNFFPFFFFLTLWDKERAPIHWSSVTTAGTRFGLTQSSHVVGRDQFFASSLLFPSACISRELKSVAGPRYPEIRWDYLKWHLN